MDTKNQGNCAEGNQHHSNCCCAQAPTNPSVCQDLDDMDFERGIWQAAIDDNTERIHHLVTVRHVCVDSTDAYGYTALHYAALNGKISAARTLIQLGANVNCQTKNNKTTPLHRAILSRTENTNMVQLLIDSGADLSLLDMDNYTPYSRALKEHKTKIIKILEGNGNFH